MTAARPIAREARSRDITTSVQRNAGTLPGEATVDLRLARRFPIRRMTIDAIFEVFNLFNRSNFTVDQQRVRHGLVSRKPRPDVRPVHAGRAAAASAGGAEAGVLIPGSRSVQSTSPC